MTNSVDKIQKFLSLIQIALQVSISTWNVIQNYFPCMSMCISQVVPYMNRPFPTSLVPLLQNESKCETFHMKMNSACSFIFMQIKVIFIRMVSHLDAL